MNRREAAVHTDQVRVVEGDRLPAASLELLSLSGRVGRLGLSRPASARCFSFRYGRGKSLARAHGGDLSASLALGGPIHDVALDQIDDPGCDVHVGAMTHQGLNRRQSSGRRGEHQGRLSPIRLPGVDVGTSLQ